jgi:hypothetical protein
MGAELIRSALFEDKLGRAKAGLVTLIYSLDIHIPFYRISGEKSR